MRTILKSLCLFLVFISFFSFIYGQGYNTIKPGTKEWSSLKTEKERFKAIQLPDKLLDTISTDELINICLNSPIYGYFSAFNSFDEGIQITINNYNGLRELLSRDNAARKLLKIYTKMDTTGYNNPGIKYDNKYWTLKFLFLELIFSQESFLDFLKSEERVELLRISRKKIDMKKKSDKFSTMYGCQPSVLILSKVMKKIDKENYSKKVKENKKIERFNKYGYPCDLKTMDDIINHCDIYLNKVNTKTKRK